VRSPMLDKARQRSEEVDTETYARSHRIAGARLDQTDLFRAEPAAVGRVVVEALEARNPQARYLVGPDAQIIGRLSPMIPTWLSDRVTRLVQGL